MRVNYTMVFVRNMERSISFYRDVIGIPLKFESPGWTEFATDGATLALHLAEPIGFQGPSALSASPGTCRPGFSTPDLDEFHKRMSSHNVTCIQEPKSIFGTRVAQYSDPDGLVFSVGENLRAKPVL